MKRKTLTPAVVPFSDAPEGPKGALSSYFCFCRDWRQRNSHRVISTIDAGQIQGQEWRSMSDERKSKFEKLAAKDRERFTAELELYKKVHGCSPPKKKVKKQVKPVKDPDKPRGAMSSYMYFCKDYRSKNKNNALSVIEAGAQQGAEWRSLPAAKRAKYDKLALQDRERHSAEMAKYKMSHPEPVPVEQETLKQAGPKKPTSSYMFFNREVQVPPFPASKPLPSL